MSLHARSLVEHVLGTPDYPVLQAYFDCRARVSAIIGPLGSGKTVTTVQRLFWQAVEQKANAKGIRPTRWLLIRNTTKDLLETTQPDVMAVLGEMGSMHYGGRGEAPEFRLRIRLSDGTFVHADFIFVGLDHLGDVRKLRGYQVTGVWLNEAKELVKPIVDMADDRHGRYPSLIDGEVVCSWHGMMLDCNAPDEDHWLYKAAEEQTHLGPTGEVQKGPEGWAVFKQPGGVLRDETGEGVPDELGHARWQINPAAENARNLPGGAAGYYLSKVTSRRYDYVRVNYANEYAFTVDGLPVHPEYQDSVHCSSRILRANPDCPLVLGIDFGRTPAAVFVQRHPALGRWYVIDELTTENMSAAIFAPELKLYLDRNYPGFRVSGWGDPAGDRAGDTVETTPIEILRAAGIPCQPAQSNVPALRRAAVAGPIRRNCMDGRPAFLISPAAKMTRKGLQGGYCYRRIKTAQGERYTDEADKNIYSHPVEALEYALMGGGEGREALRRPESRTGRPRQVLREVPRGR